MAFPENVLIRLTSETVFGPLFLTVNLTGVFALVTELAGAEEDTATSAGVLLRSRTTELRNT